MNPYLQAAAAAQGNNSQLITPLQAGAFVGGNPNQYYIL
jgi:hypothetical protein